MTQSCDERSPKEETTYNQVNARCREIDWPEKTAAVQHCSVIPNSADMGQEESCDVAQRFWNQYLYPKYIEAYFNAFPADGVNNATPQLNANSRPLDYNRKMIIALCDWLEKNGCFHYFNGQIVFIKYDAYALSMGDLLASGAPINSYKHERIAALLNELLECVIESRCKYKSATKWAIGLGVATGLLAMALLAVVPR